MKRFFLFTCVLFLCLHGCAAPSTPPTENAVSTEQEEWLLCLDGRLYSFDGPADCLQASEDSLTLAAGGTYRIRGALTDGTLRVAAPPDAVVRLILDGVTVSSSHRSPLSLEEAACVILEIEEGSVNRFTDTERGETNAPFPKGCLWAGCDLILRGTGSLSVSGRQDAALVCVGTLWQEGAALSVSAPDTGIWVRDRLTMTGGSLTVTAAKRGIVTDEGGTSAGLLSFSGGRLVVSCTDTALVASRQIRIEGTEVSLLAPTRYRAPRVDAP